MKALIETALTPAPPEEIALACEFIVSRYPAKPDAPAFAVMDKRMWLDVLGHWPGDVMAAAQRRWCSEDRPFPPKVPGEVLALGEPIMRARRALLARAERLLALPAPRADGDGDLVAPGELASLAKRLGEGLALAPTRPRPTWFAPKALPERGHG